MPQLARPYDNGLDETKTMARPG